MCLLTTLMVFFSFGAICTPTCLADEFGGTPPLLLDLVPSWPVDEYMTQAHERTIVRKLFESSPTLTERLPLIDLVDLLDAKTPARINEPALEGIGLRSDCVVDPIFSQSPVPWLVQLSTCLRDLELTLHLKHGILEITTLEQTESDERLRVYDVTALVGVGDFATRINGANTLEQSIQQHVEPKSWESLGGVGTISTSSHGRTTLLSISTRTTVHWGVQSYLNQMMVAGDIRAIVSDANATRGAVPLTAKPGISNELPPKPPASRLPVFQP